MPWTGRIPLCEVAPVPEGGGGDTSPGRDCATDGGGATSDDGAVGGGPTTDVGAGGGGGTNDAGETSSDADRAGGGGAEAPATA